MAVPPRTFVVVLEGVHAVQLHVAVAAAERVHGAAEPGGREARARAAHVRARRPRVALRVVRFAAAEHARAVVPGGCNTVFF